MLPGLYYDSFENHKRLGQVNVSPEGDYPEDEQGRTTTYSTSLSQDFETNQVTELLSRYGPIREMWIDTPSSWGAAIEPIFMEKSRGCNRTLSS